MTSNTIAPTLLFVYLEICYYYDMQPQLIAVVEDEASIREMYALKLRAAGYSVVTANDGNHALKVLEKHTPDLILLDIRMPFLPGNEVLRRIRQTDWGANVKVIVLTNISKSEAPQEFRFLGVDRYIVKVHHTPTQVLEIIKEVLEYYYR